ncbi:MFS transporter [Moritella viscosa]|uniref:Permease n=1 Tax=Moritella viscosa TaxID=80854 RepID=A0A1K9ZXM3_9GAMM|nr:MFS transporter [Moritella viscosa]SGZ04162.1 Permease [Moritella viscosa]SGZ17089.1 Permease [Moritella viscosa]SGZ18613.1 Permease [Moritella viscosa]SHN99174.1 Permease [Moritella viscosa]SHN99176.1 Permease [Moritella viscosa]
MIRLTWKQKIGAVTGNALEFYDIAVFASISGFISVLFSHQGIEHAEYVVWGIFALRFLVRPLGGLVIGHYAKNHGVRSALILTNLMIGLATLSMAFMPVEALGKYIVVAFLLLQIVQAFSFGGEYPTLISYLHQGTDQADKSKTSSLIVASSLAGVVISLVVVYALNQLLTVEEMNNYGWRLPLLVGVLNTLMSLYVRLSLPALPLVKTVIRPMQRSRLIFRIFMVTIIGAVIFYTQNFASKMIGEELKIENLPLINSLLLLSTLAFVGWFTDKYSSVTQVFRFSSIALALCSIPLFLLLSSGDQVYMGISIFLFTLISGALLGNLAAVLWQESEGDIISLGFGYNIALSLFGGATPLIIGLLIPKGFAFVGLYVALAAIPALVILSRPNTKVNTKIQTAR